MILLSFDIEEFDMPFEYGKEISFEDQMSISIAGTNAILDILDKHDIKATFFSTVTFALNASDVIKRIVASGHEIASHSYYHSDFKEEHLLSSKLKLEEITGQKVLGYRMPRMQPVSESAIQKAGYVYNSSINPTYLPGRYNNLHISRTFFMKDGVWQLPASVSPIVRFPLFWLSFHNLPMWLYIYLSKITLKKDNYLNIYFHPWEFTDLTDKQRFGFPNYVSKNTGKLMANRFENFIIAMKKNNCTFHSTKELINKI
jgi:peptidoglycan/xylan/chitin deacetylase (PgdA/CDA1 family)